MADPAAELLRRARTGDLDAFGELVRLHEPRVRAIVSRLLDDQRDIEEAAQDTFVQAWRALPRFREDAALSTWLHRIAVNEALQRLRRKRLDVQRLEDEPAVGAHEVAAAMRPEEIAEDAEATAFVAERLRALPLELRTPLVLRDLVGFSNREIAEALEVTVSAAKSRIHRARMQLRSELAAWLATRR